MKKITFLIVLLIPSLSYSQSYYQDAMRFSNTQPLGSARIQAMGGASVALGADPSTITSNPAGLGLYNRSEFSITPAFNFSQSKSNLNGQSTTSSKSKFSLDQISGVFSNPKDGTGSWLGGAWGFGIQKVNDFNNRVSYAGNNSNNSLIDYFIENSYGYPTSDFPDLEDAFDLTSLAYYNYLIGPYNVIDTVNYPDDEYFSDVTTFFRPNIHQEESIETSGSQYEYTLGYGGNFADVFYFGFNVGITSLNYEASKTYSESNFDYSQTDSTSYNPINSFTTTEKLMIDGIGANLTIGLIIRPIPSFRIGASLSTATVYELRDSYETTLGAEWNNFYYQDLIDGDTLLNSTFAESAIIQSVYSLKTPTKYSLGAAIFLGKLGFITLDAEFLNYGRTTLDSEEFSMVNENDYIKTNFSNQANIRTGIEIRLSPLRFRAGFALNDIPVDSQNNLTYSNQSYSAGTGLLFDQLYTDFALIYNKKTAQYSPYLLSDYSEPVVDISTNTIRGVFTLGYKF